MSLDYDFEKKECRWKALPGEGPALEAGLASEAERAGNGSLLPGIRQLDRGCDFYAPQTFCDENGRRILIGWMGIPDAGYTNPTTENGWQHALTLPRQLRLKNGKMIQTPLKELEGLRCSEERFTFPADCAAGREEGSLSGCAAGSLSAPAADSVIAAGAGLCYEAELDFERCESLCLTLRRGVKLLYKKDNMEQNGKSETAGLLTLKLGQAGSGRPDRSVYLDGLKDLRIYSDASSLEIFVNGGEEVFTTRVYGTKPEWRIEGECRGTGRCFRLGTFKIEERKEHGCGE